MTWGVRAEFYERVKREKGRDPPDEFLNPPKLPGHLIFYADAFWRLNSDRPAGMGLGPIPFAAIDRYARRYRIEGEHFERFLRLIRVQDGEYLRLAHRKHDSKTIEVADTTDTSGVKSILARLSERAEAIQNNRLNEEDEEPDDERD